MEERDSIIKRAIFAKHGRGGEFFTAEDLLTVAGITIEDEEEILSELDKIINSKGG